MPGLCSFDYAIVRIVPRPEREEFVNAGVILYCRERRYLDVRLAFDAKALHRLNPELDPSEIEQHLALIAPICAGGPGAGEIGALSQVERFRWLTSPRSTVIQVSPVHAGLCSDPAETIERLLRAAVA